MGSVSKYNLRTTLILSSSGWGPERRVDVSDYEAHLKQYGFIISPIARELLREFRGLKICYPFDAPNGVMAHLDFQADYSPACDAESAHDWSELIKAQSMCLIGFNTASNQCLLVADDGRMFSGLEPEKLYYYGANPVEGIENMLRGKDATIARAF